MLIMLGLIILVMGTLSFISLIVWSTLHFEKNLQTKEMVFCSFDFHRAARVKVIAI